MAFLLVETSTGLVNAIVPPVGEWTPPAGFTAVIADGVTGDTWDGTKCVPSPAPVPLITVTRRQFFLQLERAGIYDEVNAFIANYPYAPVRIEFQNATEFRSDSATLYALTVLEWGWAVDAYFAFLAAASKIE